MTAAGLRALLPLLILGATPVLVLVLVAIRRHAAASAGLTLAGLAATLVACLAAPGDARPVTALLVVDRYALFCTGLLVAATIAVVLFGHAYFRARGRDPEEFHVLATIAVLGAAVLAASRHLVSFFLGLEVLSIALYAMTAYLDARGVALEAGVKYLVLAATSAAFLLFGMALVYAETGTMELARIAQAVAAGGGGPLLLPGMALIVTGIGFKLALVPFHLWTPDVYEGAPAPATLFVATVSKGGMFALLLRLFRETRLAGDATVVLAFSILAIASMVAGNLLALRQANVKRILAYSSIAHLGYLLVAFLAGGALGAAAAIFYLVAYFVTMLGAFGVVTVLSRTDRDADSIEDYRGLSARRPALAAVFAAMLLSLAGIPLTAGFVGKFVVVAASASAAAWPLVLVLVVTSAIGLFYYLRIVVALFSPAGDVAGPAVPPPLPRAGALALGALTVLLVWLGVQPGPMMDAIRAAVASLG